MSEFSHAPTGLRAPKRKPVEIGRVILCGSTCGHSHDSLNGPTGCCSEHGPYMYFCDECHHRWLASLTLERRAELAEFRGAPHRPIQTVDLLGDTR